MKSSLVVNERAITLAKRLFSDERLPKLLDLLEDKDVQFSVVREIVDICPDVVTAAVIILGVSLVSYQLSRKGEEHWKWLLSLIRKSTPSGLDDAFRMLKLFVMQSPSLMRLRRSRLGRIDRFIRSFVPAYVNKFPFIWQDLHSIWLLLSREMSSPRDSKTIVFAIKMYYYVLKALEVYINPPMEIPIPADYRVCLVSLTSGIVSAYPRPTGPKEYRSLARLLKAKKQGLVRSVWADICGCVNVPPLRIDSLLWIFGGIIDRNDMQFPLCEQSLSNLLTGDSLRYGMVLLKFLMNDIRIAW